MILYWMQRGTRSNLLGVIRDHYHRTGEYPTVEDLAAIKATGPRGMWLEVHGLVELGDVELVAEGAGVYRVRPTESETT